MKTPREILLARHQPAAVKLDALRHAAVRVVAAAESDARPRPSPLDPRPLGWLSTLNAQLTVLLWPHPKAWAGLAAVWLVILAANFATRETAPKDFARQSPQMRELLRQQQQLFAELVGPKEHWAADCSKPAAPQPRSQRREEFMNA